MAVVVVVVVFVVVFLLISLLSYILSPEYSCHIIERVRFFFFFKLVEIVCVLDVTECKKLILFICLLGMCTADHREERKRMVFVYRILKHQA